MTEAEISERAVFQAQVDSCLDQGNFKAALELAERRLALIPGDVDATIVIAHAWLKLGSIDKALATLSEVEDKISRFGGLYLSLGEVCLKAGLLQEALRFFRRYLAICPSSPKAHQVKEKILCLSGTPALKETEEESLADEPAPEFYTLSLVDLYISQGHFDLAERLLQVIVSREDKQEEARERFRRLQEARSAALVASLEEKRRSRVLAELNRWLNNALRMKSYAHRSVNPCFPP